MTPDEKKQLENEGWTLDARSGFDKNPASNGTTGTSMLFFKSPRMEHSGMFGMGKNYDNITIAELKEKEKQVFTSMLFVKSLPWFRSQFDLFIHDLMETHPDIDFNKLSSNLELSYETDS